MCTWRSLFEDVLPFVVGLPDFALRPALSGLGQGFLGVRALVEQVGGAASVLFNTAQGLLFTGLAFTKQEALGSGFAALGQRREELLQHLVVNVHRIVGLHFLGNGGCATPIDGPKGHQIHHQAEAVTHFHVMAAA